MSCCKDEKKTPFTEYSIIKAGKSIIKHFTDSSYNAFVEESEKKQRLKICEDCDQSEEFMGKKRCKICKCFLTAKASLADQSCPHPDGNKWQR